MRPLAKMKQSRIRFLHFSYPNTGWKKRKPSRIHFYTFCIPSLSAQTYPKDISPPNFVTQFPRGLCHKAALKKKQKRIRILHMSYSCTVWWKRENIVDYFLHFVYTLSVLIKSSKVDVPAQLRDTISAEIVSRVCLQKGNRRGCDVFTFRIPPLSDETGESMRIHFYNFCIPPLCLQKPSETIWPAQLRDTITTVIVSRGGLQKGNRRGYDVYTFRIPSQCHEKGEPLRIHFYSFCIPSRLKDKSEVGFSCPISWHNCRGICVTRGCLQKRNRRGYEFYTCRIPALSDEKGENVAGSLLHFGYPLSVFKKSSEVDFLAQDSKC